MQTHGYLLDREKKKKGFTHSMVRCAKIPSRAKTTPTLLTIFLPQIFLPKNRWALDHPLEFSAAKISVPSAVKSS
jgi:hypothetical protein